MKRIAKPVKIILLFIFVFVFSSFFAKNSSALTTKTGSNVVVSDKEKISDNLFIAGQVVKIESDVDGDVFCAGQTVEINAHITGDVLCAAQNVVIGGLVNGNVRVLSQSLSLTGVITRNVNFFGQSIISDANIDRDIFFGSQLARINGSVKRNILGVAENVILGANVGNGATLYVTSLNIESGAKINGDLTYESNNDAEISKDASISGKITRNIPKPQEQQKKQFTGRFERTPQNYLVSRLKSLILNLVIALVLVYFLKNFFGKITSLMLANVKNFSLIGLLVLILIPILSFLVMLTIIGIPFGLVGLILLGFAMYLARILSSVAVGIVFTNKYIKAQKESILFAAGFGVIVSWIGFSIPFLGGILSFFYVIWGLGALYKYHKYCCPGTSIK